MGSDGLETRVRFGEDATPGKVFSGLLDRVSGRDQRVLVFHLERTQSGVQSEDELQAWPNGDGFFSLSYFMKDAQQPAWTTRIDDQGNTFQTRGISSDELTALMNSLVTGTRTEHGIDYELRYDATHHQPLTPGISSLRLTRRDLALAELR